MARIGSSGISTNPFGTGSLGGLSQYNLGDSLRDLARYQAEVAWGNGQLSDEEYLAVLRNDVTAAAPGTRDYIAAVNRLDDVKYRIDRQKAEQEGLDALIAFDQRTLATMREDNLRYRDVKDSLASELARRRSRDYAKLVDDYNAGKGGSTESLLAWVRATVASMPDDAPDKDNWTEVASDLEARIQDEKDADAYQDYQMRRMKPDDFLAYVKARRDSYDPDSPKYDEWSRRYEDAEKSVRDTKQAAADQAFFNKYNEGKVSDKAYLAYLKKRLDSMPSDDPNREEWRHRLAEATFSLAEDLLVYQVNRGQQSVSTLVKFYKDYRTGLNPGSAEYRRITEKIISLGGRTGGGGGGGGGGGTRRSSSGGGATKPANIGGEKVIGKGGDISTYLAYLTPNPSADPKSRGAAEKYLSLNYDSLQNAHTRGDRIWLFYDPAKPGQKVQARDPLTGEPIVGRDGKPVMVYGSKYLPVSSQALADLDMVQSNYNLALAQQALAKGDTKRYAMYLGRSINAADHARYVQAKAVVRDTTKVLDTLDKGIEYATSVGDAATVINLLVQKGTLIENALRDGSLDEARRTKLEDALDDIGRNPLWPAGDGQGRQVGGFVDIANSPRDRDGNLIPGAAVLNPNVHFVIDGVDANGKSAPKFVYDDGPPGTWEQNHRRVNITNNGAVVRGEARVQNAPTNMMVVVRTDAGEKLVPFGPQAQYMTWVDANGRRVHAYSIDGGQSWLQTLSAGVPMTEIRGNFRWQETDPATGAGLLLDADGNKAFAFDGSAWKADEAWAATATMDWYAEPQLYRDRFNAPIIGGPGMRGYIKQANADGSINFIPEEVRLSRYAAARQDKSLALSRARGGEQARGAEAFEAYDDLKRANSPEAKRQKRADDAWSRRLSAQSDKQFDAASGDSRTAARLASMPTPTTPRPNVGAPPRPLLDDDVSILRKPPETVGPLPPVVNRSTGFTLPSAKPTAPPKLTTTNSKVVIDKTTGQKKAIPKPTAKTVTPPKPTAKTVTPPKLATPTYKPRAI
jgi:hypothetical protein